MKVLFVFTLLACVLITIEADGECSPAACKISKDLSLNVKGENHCCDPKKYSFIVSDPVKDNVTQSCTCYE
ncbi:hypothetical protein RRG08_007287 [Elysia crispata]|uniref:Plethodontid modulating factor n=1 Tax=Elysia crispata TaxID=231223 RepID=A0AAE0Z3Z6_9GAST|nr:hypothetical protein RRG08_007287 [Elysia crispata]